MKKIIKLIGIVFIFFFCFVVIKENVYAIVRCTNNSDCSSGYSCTNPTGGMNIGICKKSCTSDSQCGADGECIDSVCININQETSTKSTTTTDPTKSITGLTCKSDSDCQAPRYCSKSSPRDEYGLCMNKPTEPEELRQGDFCGYDGYDTTKYKCPSGTSCTPYTCISDQKLVEWRCQDPNNQKPFSQDMVSACNKYGNLTEDYLNKERAERICIEKGTGVETGIFTKGLSPQCLGCGDCSQKDVFQEFVNIFTFILQISGGLAVLVLVVGGLMYMTAAGDQQKTGQAKAALTAAIVGIIIVLTSFLIISFVMTSLGYTNADKWYTFSVTLK